MRGPTERRSGSVEPPHFIFPSRTAPFICRRRGNPWTGASFPEEQGLPILSLSKTPGRPNPGGLMPQSLPHSARNRGQDASRGKT